MDVYVAEAWAMEVTAFNAPILPMHCGDLVKIVPLKEVVVVPYLHMEPRSLPSKNTATAPRSPLLRKDFLMETP
jgi:hypothetical protein